MFRSAVRRPLGPRTQNPNVLIESLLRPVRPCWTPAGLCLQPMSPPNTSMPPVVRLERIKGGASSPPNASMLFQSLKSFRSLSAEDLRRNPLLKDSLRRLRAQTLGAGSEPRATSASLLGKHTPFLTAADIEACKAVKGGMVVRDDALRASLSSLKKRTELLRTIADARKYSAVGERPVPKPCPGLPPSKMHPAGRYTIASIGPGFMGPHRCVESYRRPRGTGNR